MWKLGIYFVKHMNVHGRTGERLEGILNDLMYLDFQKFCDKLLKKKKNLIWENK